MANSLGVSATLLPLTVTLCVRTSTVSTPCCTVWPVACCLLRRMTALILASSSWKPNGLIR